MFLFAHLSLLPRARAEDRIHDALEVVNSYRRAAGLAPVELDERMNQACREHTRYLVLNAGRPALEGLKAHQQDSHLPGASPEGAWCGKNADLFPKVGSPAAAVHGWMDSLYHRTPIMEPSLRAVGIAESPYPQGGVAAALMFDPDSGPAPAESWPVRYPAAEQTGVPLNFTGEVPDPTYGAAYAGYPVTLHFPGGDKLSRLSAKLFDSAGHELPVYLSSPGKPATSFPQGSTVCLVPKVPLRPAAHYWASIQLTWQGSRRDYRWHFQTEDPRRIDAQDVAALRRREQLPTWVVGKVAHAFGQKEAGDHAGPVMLRLQGPNPDSGLVIELASELWAKIAGGRLPAAFLGRFVQVLGTPQDAAPGMRMKALDGEFLPQAALAVVDAADPAALLSHLGERVRLRGLLSAGGALADGSGMFLHLNDRAVVAFVPQTVWRTAAGAHLPSEVLGYTAELEVVLEDVKHGLQVQAYEDGQLRLMPPPALAVLDAADAAALGQRVGQRVKVRGVITGNGPLQKSSDFYLQLNDRALVAFVSLPAWRAALGGRQPTQVLGAGVEIEGLLERSDGELRMSLPGDGQLRLVPGELPVLDAKDAAALLRHIGRRVKVRGLLTHGGKVSNGSDLFLHLGDRAIIVFVPPAVWHAAAGGRPPTSDLGYGVELEGLLTKSRGEPSLTVYQAAELRILPPRDLPVLAAEDAAALASHLGQRVKVRGCIAFGGQVDNGVDLFLYLHDKSLVAFIPPPVWHAVAGGRLPDQVIGQKAELEALLEKSGDRIELHVHEKAQLHLLPQ